MKKIISVLTMLIIIISGAVSASAAANVAALMYHNVTSDESRWGDYTISPEQLESDIQYFQSCGYMTMTATELATANMSDIDGKKILLLTFDDGYSSFYSEVYPVLKRNNAKGTMYLIGSYINRYGYLTEEETYEMAHSGLIEIGNHTNSIHHTPVELLHGIYNSSDSFYEVIEDIKRNGERLKEITGLEITSMSWPYGYYTVPLDTEVKNQLGYKISFSTEYDVNYFSGNTSAPLKRMNRECSASTQWVFDRANSRF